MNLEHSVERVLKNAEVCRAISENLRYDEQAGFLVHIGNKGGITVGSSVKEFSDYRALQQQMMECMLQAVEGKKAISTNAFERFKEYLKRKMVAYIDEYAEVQRRQISSTGAIVLVKTGLNELTQDAEVEHRKSWETEASARLRVLSLLDAAELNTLRYIYSDALLLRGWLTQRNMHLVHVTAVKQQGSNMDFPDLLVLNRRDYQYTVQGVESVRSCVQDAYEKLTGIYNINTRKVTLDSQLERALG